MLRSLIVAAPHADYCHLRVVPVTDQVWSSQRNQCSLCPWAAKISARNTLLRRLFIYYRDELVIKAGKVKLLVLQILPFYSLRHVTGGKLLPAGRIVDHLLEAGPIVL